MNRESFQRTTFVSLQHGRAIAALLVVGLHAHEFVERFFAATWLTGFFAEGWRGVQFFFALSGFIILVSHYGDTRRGLGVGSFLIKRAIRVVPVFLIIYALYSPLWFLVPGVGNELTRSGVVWLKGLFLVPTLLESDVYPYTIPHLQPAWTLTHELMFYGLLALFICRPKTGAAVLGFWFVLCALDELGNHPVSSLSKFPLAVMLNPLNLWFLVGIAALAAFMRRGQYVSEHVSARLFAVGVLLALGGYVAFYVGLLAAGAFTAVLVVGIFLFLSNAGADEVEQRLEQLTVLSLLGDASYSIYLVHHPVLSVLTQLSRKSHLLEHLNANAFFILLVASSVIAGVGFHKVVERPVLTWFRKRLKTHDGGMSVRENVTLSGDVVRPSSFGTHGGR